MSLTVEGNRICVMEQFFQETTICNTGIPIRASPVPAYMARRRPCYTTVYMDEPSTDSRLSPAEPEHQLLRQLLAGGDVWKLRRCPPPPVETADPRRTWKIVRNARHLVTRVISDVTQEEILWPPDLAAHQNEARTKRVFCIFAKDVPRARALLRGGVPKSSRILQSSPLPGQPPLGLGFPEPKARESARNTEQREYHINIVP